MTATQNANDYYDANPALASLGDRRPAVQQTISTAEYGCDAFNTQAGSTQPGAFGFEWHKVEIDNDGNNVTWDIDDVLIATVALAPGSRSAATTLPSASPT